MKLFIGEGGGEEEFGEEYDETPKTEHNRFLTTYVNYYYCFFFSGKFYFCEFWSPVSPSSPCARVVDP